MLPLFYDEHADPGILRGRRISIIGYGAQGRAQALNLRDGGWDVVVGLRPRSPRRKEARRDRVPVVGLKEAAASGSLLMLLVPDEIQGDLFRRSLAPHLKTGATLGFSHGLSYHFGLIEVPPEIDVILVAPKGPGRLLRRRYQEGEGLPALAAAGQDASGRAWPTALAYASAIGCCRAGVIRTTFEEEAVTDLFGEQAVLTGGMAELARAAYETLVERGYRPEVAYIECVQELLGLADIIFERGIAGMRDVVSSPARWGGIRGGREVMGTALRRRLRDLLREVESGRRVRWMRRLTPARKRQLARLDREHHIERVGRRVRERLHWPGGSVPTERETNMRRKRKKAKKLDSPGGRG